MKLVDYLLPPWFMEAAFIPVLLLGIAVAAGLVVSGIFHVTLGPHRRRERSIMMLDLMQRALDMKRPTTEILAAVLEKEAPLFGAAKQDHLCDSLRKAPTLSAALEGSNSSLLPEECVKLIHLGEKTGTLKELLPVCRETIAERSNPALNHHFKMLHQVILCSPAFLLFAWIIHTHALPKFRMIELDMVQGVLDRSHWSSFMTDLPMAWCFVPLLCAWIWYAVDGPLGSGWVMALFKRTPLRAWAEWEAWIPWRRKRILKLQIKMLTRMLRAGMSDRECLEWAVSSCVHPMIHKRMERARHELQQGRSLQEALVWLDDSSGTELRWRLQNSHHGKEALIQVLEGWAERLTWDAREQEHLFKQSLGVILVFMNGLLVGGLACRVFSWLVSLMDAISLW